MAGRRQTTPEQEAAMWAGFLGGRSGSQIHREMQVNGLLTHPHPNVTIRLVQSRLREMQQMTPPDESGPWSVIDADPEDARRVLDVAAYVADVTDGRLWLTRELAGWVSRIRQASPDVPPAWAYALARAYRTLSKQPPEQQDARPLDIVLAAEPWQSEERASWYRELVQRSERELGRQPKGLWVEVAALLDTRPGAPAGSFGSPWARRPRTPDGSP